jgi:transposase
MKSQRSFSAEFKRQVIEELMSGESRPAQLCRRHNISSSLLYHWKKQYSRGRFNNEPTAEGALRDRVEKLERLVGKLTGPPRRHSPLGPGGAVRFAGVRERASQTRPGHQHGQPRQSLRKCHDGEFLQDLNPSSTVKRVFGGNLRSKLLVWRAYVVPNI